MTKEFLRNFRNFGIPEIPNEIYNSLFHLRLWDLPLLRRGGGGAFRSVRPLLLKKKPYGNVKKSLNVLEYSIKLFYLIGKMMSFRIPTDLLEERRRRRFQATLHKIRAHINIRGNDLADAAAKMAVTQYDSLPE